MADSTAPELHTPLQAPLRVSRHENFESWYANNIQLIPSEWDLRMLFGEVDFTQMIVQQHTAMTVTWLQAKLLLYFLTVQVGIYELMHKKIDVPPSVQPIDPQPPTGEIANDPDAQKVYEYMKKLRAQFIDSLK